MARIPPELDPPGQVGYPLLDLAGVPLPHQLDLAGVPPPPQLDPPGEVGYPHSWTWLGYLSPLPQLDLAGYLPPPPPPGWTWLG